MQDLCFTEGTAPGQGSVMPTVPGTSRQCQVRLRQLQHCMLSVGLPKMGPTYIRGGCIPGKSGECQNQAKVFVFVSQTVSRFCVGSSVRRGTHNHPDCPVHCWTFGLSGPWPHVSRTPTQKYWNHPMAPSAGCTLPMWEPLTLALVGVAPEVWSEARLHPAALPSSEVSEEAPLPALSSSGRRWLCGMPLRPPSLACHSWPQGFASRSLSLIP